MIQFVYVSTAVALVADEEVQRILEVSRRNNEQVGVTGLLLYNGRRFLQALEGDEGAVQTTYERIKVDPRHRSVSIVSSSPIRTRMFGEWSMAARRTGGESDAATLLAQVEAMTSGLSPSLREHFVRYAQMGRGSATS